MKRLGTLVLGAAALAAVQGCSDEATLYLSGPPGAAAKIEISNSAVTVVIGKTAMVGARAEDAVGNATGDAVTLSACDGLVSVTPGSATSQWSATATVTGAGMGETCVLAQAAGMTDTIRLTVGPAGVAIVGPDTILSGTGGEYTTTAVDAAGNPISGTVPLAWSSANTARLVVGAPTGQARGRSPGKVDVQVTAPGGATAEKEVVVVTGVFAGTLSATSGQPGGLITVARAADGEQWDEDTQVKLGSVTAWVDVFTSSNLTFAIPATGSTSSQTLGFTNMGPGQVAQNGSFTPTLAKRDKYDPGNVDNTCSIPATVLDYDAAKSPGNAVYIVHDGASVASGGQGTGSCLDAGGDGYDHWFTFKTGATGITDIVANWRLAGDYDLVVCDAAAKVAANAGDCEYGYSGNANDETMTGLELTPNTQYWFAFEVWSGNSGINNARIAVTAK